MVWGATAPSSASSSSGRRGIGPAQRERARRGYIHPAPPLKLREASLLHGRLIAGFRTGSGRDQIQRTCHSG
eukprot:6470485-Prymnesium_polylepis.1